MYRRKKASIIRKKKESGKKSPTRKCRKTLPSAFSPALKYLPGAAKGLGKIFAPFKTYAIVKNLKSFFILGSKSRNVSHNFETDMEGFLDDWNTAEKDSGSSNRSPIGFDYK